MGPTSHEHAVRSALSHRRGCHLRAPHRRRPGGEAVAVGIEWVKLHGAAVFRVTGATFGGAINSVYQVLRAIPPILIILATAIFAWRMQRSIALALFVVAGLLLIMNQGYWQQTLETLSLVLVATFATTAIGVPLGIACARH